MQNPQLFRPEINPISKPFVLKPRVGFTEKQLTRPFAKSSILSGSIFKHCRRAPTIAVQTNSCILVSGVSICPAVQCPIITEMTTIAMAVAESYNQK
jgi:hypothetical protein